MTRIMALLLSASISTSPVFHKASPSLSYNNVPCTSKAAPITNTKAPAFLFFNLHIVSCLPPNFPMVTTNGHKGHPQSLQVDIIADKSYFIFQRHIFFSYIVRYIPYDIGQFQNAFSGVIAFNRCQRSGPCMDEYAKRRALYAACPNYL